MTAHTLFDADLYWLRSVRTQMQCISHLIGDVNFTVANQHSFRDTLEWLDRKIAQMETYKRAQREREAEAAVRAKENAA